MVKTRGLTHIALAVRDVDRAAAFYQRVLGAVEIYRGDGFVQLQTPGSWDVLVLERQPSKSGKRGAVMHFGFRLVRPGDIAQAVKEMRSAGGKIVETGEFVPGEPYVFAEDPEGNVIEIWYELPTKADPTMGKRRRARRT